MEVFKFADCELDIARQELRRGGAVYALEPQVFDLLQYLIEHRDRLVSRDELFDTVWRDRTVSDWALSSRIKSARKAIGDSGKRQELIRTARRRGFRFVGPVEELHRPKAAALELPDKPSIAVLPFANISDDPRQEYFSDGITEDIITALSKFHWLFVIARNSTLAYKDTPVDVVHAAGELGVRYLLEGSVRKAGDMVRVTAQLLDGASGNHVWAERYDRRLDDIFVLQDEITETIAGRLDTELRTSEMERARRKPPANLDAWDLYQRGTWHADKVTMRDNEAARHLFQQAMERDPDFAPAHAAFALTCYVEVNHGYGDDPVECLAAGLAAAEKAVTLDDNDGFSHFALGRLLTLAGQGERAIAKLEKSVALNPSFARGYHGLGLALNYYGRSEDAIPMFDMAMRLSPHGPLLWGMQNMRAACCNNLENYELAEEWARKAINTRADQFWPYIQLTVALVGQSRLEEAREVVAAGRRLKPGLSLAVMDRLVPHAHPEHRARHLKALRLAGLPE
jgi:TolB-like protein